MASPSSALLAAEVPSGNAIPRRKNHRATSVTLMNRASSTKHGTLAVILRVRDADIIAKSIHGKSDMGPFPIPGLLGGGTPCGCRNGLRNTVDAGH